MGSKRNAFFLRPFATAIGTCVLLHQFGTEQSLGAKKKKKKKRSNAFPSEDGPAFCRFQR